MTLARSTILLIEDDTNDVLLFQRTLKGANYDKPIQLVRNGEEALAYLDGQRSFSDHKQYPLPNLVFLDLKLPGLSGFEVLTWIRQQARFKRLQIVVLTGSPLTIDIYRAYELGANGYLVKPIKVHDLLELPKSMRESYPMLPKDNIETAKVSLLDRL